MATIASEIKHYKDIAKEYESMYLRMAVECASLETRLEQEIKINDWYRQWFSRNAHWVQRFNNMMKYDPRLGNYNRKGADDPIVIPEPEYWERVPEADLRRISPVCEIPEQE